MYYHATHGQHKTQTQVMKAHIVYDKFKSRELITAFNKQCMYISYKSISLSDPILKKLLFFRVF